MGEAEDEQAKDARVREQIAVYRRNALECLDEIKNAAINSTTRAILYWMALEWLRLAAKVQSDNFKDTK
jgi:hypothetical protein